MRLPGQHLLLLALCGIIQLHSLAQEYPFIHYTPKDGLINSRIRNVYQDSKGRLFFMTSNGISEYDGVRFNNYSVEDGVGNPVVNDMLEIAPDSVLLASNTYMLNAWVRGQIKKVAIEGFCPVVNKFLRVKDGLIYVATDEGVFLMKGNRFEKMETQNVPITDTALSFEDIQEFGDYLLLKINGDMTKQYGLYLLDKKNKTLIPFIQKEFGSVIQVPRFNILMCTSGHVTCYDLQAARKGFVKPVPLPQAYQILQNVISYRLFIDQNETLWSVYLNTVIKIPSGAPPTIYDKTTGLDLNNLNGVFVDKENVLWVRSDGSGLIKLSNSNVEIVTGLVSKSATGISSLYANKFSDTAWLYNHEENAIYGITNKEVAHYSVDQKMNPSAIIREGDHFFLFNYTKVYVASPDPRDKRNLHAKLSFTFGDQEADNTTRTIIDNGYLYTPGPNLSVIKNGKRIFTYKLPYYTDQIVIDKTHRLWLAPRSGGIMLFSIHPENPSQFLVLERRFESETSYISARSIAVDTNNLLWVGTRYQGLFCFEARDSSLILKKQFTVQDGITDNFISYVTCDHDNNIWVGSQSGLDKISMRNGQYQVEGTTRNNNIFQLIQSVAVTKNDQVWTLGNAGSILRINNNELQSNYRPQIQISRIKTTDTVFGMPKNNLTLPYLENNITFEVAAPSFVDEKQVMFSYILEGSRNAVWSKPSREATFNFINLPHGKYKLKVKASFPLASYGNQEMSYAFTITPPWWDTWWSKLLFIAGIVAILVLAIRNYYQRKLQKQKVIFEKQQAVEHERTRIAMEMHDDLGSGLTTIRYLAGGLSMQTGNSSKEKAEKIASSAKSLVDNMNDIIWSMKSDNNTLNETLAYIRKQAAEQLETAGIEYHIDFPKELPDIKLSNELKRNLLLISKEAIHNVVKHSAATSVILNAQWEGGSIQLKIVDNGKGIDFADISTFGNGMKSMRKRAEEIKALLEVMNAKGTTIVIKAPV
jgi:signal transduction histidine kinase/ligand-binding sensor domain-containing protein